MTDTLEVDHAEAGLLLLRADAQLTVYPDANGFVPTDVADHYVRVYTSIERPPGAAGASNTLSGRSDTWIVRQTAHCVGPSEHAASAVAGRVRSAWLDVTPTVAGRTCKPIRQDADLPANRDTSTGVEVFDKVVVYRWRTSPG